MTWAEGMPQWQLAELAAGFGGPLGMSLDLTWGSHGVRLGVEGDGVYVSEPYNRRGRLLISGWYPSCRRSFRGELGSITVRADRGPGVIASEVQHRLLPGYREVVARMRAYNATAAAEDAARVRLAELICGLFPEQVTSMPSHCQSDNRSEIFLHLPGPGGGGGVQLWSDGGEVLFDRLRVPAPVALRMLETAALMTRFDPPDKEEEADDW